MSRAKRLQPVVALAEREVARSGEALRMAKDKLAEAQTQRDELQEYLAEYSAPQLGPGSVAALSRRRAFAGRLAGALVEQDKLLQQLTELVRQRVEQLASAQHKCRSLLDLITRLQRDEARLADKREARALEDLPRRPPPFG